MTTPVNHPTGRREVLESVITGVCVAVCCGLAECAINETIQVIRERRAKAAKAVKKRTRERKTKK